MAHQDNDRAFGRVVNGADDAQLISTPPAAARFSVFEFIDSVASDPNNGGLSFGPALCDGDGNLDGALCDDLRGGTAGAMEALQIAKGIRGLSDLITHPLVNTRVVTDANLAEMWQPGARIRTVESSILDRVEHLEYRMHRLGRRMSRSDGLGLGRAFLVRWVLLFELMYNVPVVDAQAFTFEPLMTFFWTYWGFWLEFVEFSVLGSRRSFYEASYQRQYQSLSDSYESCAAWAIDASACWWRWLFAWVIKPHYIDLAKEGFHLKHALVPDNSMQVTTVAIILCLCALMLTLAATHTAYRVGRLAVKYVADWRLTAKLSEAEKPSSSTTPVSDFDKVAQLLRKNVLSMFPADMFEMSQKGSSIAESTHVGGLMQLVKLVGDDTICVGMAFRYHDYLVTVEHNITALDSQPGKNYLVPFTQNGEGSVMDASRHFELTREHFESDVVPAVFKNMFDIALIPLGNRVFSRLGVASVQSTDAVWGAPMLAVGLTTNSGNKLQRSVGKVIKTPDEALYKLFYNASTVNGWSGGPILNKRKVIAVHCGNNGKLNYGLNFFVVKRIVAAIENCAGEAGIDAHAFTHITTPSKSYSSEHTDEFRDARGYEAEFDDYGEDEGVDVGYLTRAKHSGSLGYTTRDRVRLWLDYKSKTGRNWADEDYNDEPRHINVGRGLESNMTRPCTRPTITIPAEERIKSARPPSPVYDPFEYLAGNALKKEKRDVRLSSPFYKGKPDDADRYIDLDKARALGYEEGKYIFPPAKNYAEASTRSKTALANYLRMAVEARASGCVPEDEVRTLAIKICSDVMKPARVRIDCSGVTRDKIIKQINSSLVGGSRSPGLPFVPKYQTNADLIADLGVEGLADLTMEYWESGEWKNLASVNFIKLEPTKVSKIEECKDRCIQSVSLIVQLLFRCMLDELHDTLKKSLGKVPVVMGWSPTNPGHADLAITRLLSKKGADSSGQILSYDGQAFEYTSHKEWNYADVTSILLGMFVPDESERSPAWANFCAQFTEFMDAVGKSPITCADGTTILKEEAWILSSGRYDTYVRNSFTGMYNDVVAKLIAGYSVNEVKESLKRAIFGGDDNVQWISDNQNVQGFINSFETLGLPIHEVELRKPKEGFQFFSWNFNFDSRGSVKFVPSRFTKHIENYRTSEHEFRPEGLRSLMMVWIHDYERFMFFREIFLKGHESEPDLFRLDLLVDRLQFLNYVNGNETAGKAGDPGGEFLENYM